jgi:protein-S-isoprenylcysteine O-methyltransferase Ste14
MSGEPAQLAWLAAGWAAYFAFHSLAASLRLKTWLAGRWPRLVPGYRLLFNTLAVVLILPLAWLTFTWPGPALWEWTGAWRWAADGAALAAIGLFAWSLRFYDGGSFVGWRQWREGQRGVHDTERLHISPMHRYVRHPWYALGLVVVWTRSMDAAMLVTALAITVYLVIGSRLEERKLLVYHGEAYRRYMERVPGLIPLPWRRLKSGEAERIAALARSRRD